MIFLFPPGVQCAVTHNSMSNIVLKVLLKSISVKRYRHNLWQLKSITKILILRQFYEKKKENDEH